MAKEINRTLIRLCVLRVSMRESCDDRPIRKYTPGDGTIIAEIVQKVRVEYSSQIAQLREQHLKGSPDFQKIKRAFIKQYQEQRQWSLGTRNFFSSVVAMYITLAFQKKEDDVIVSLEELAEYEKLFLNKIT